MRTCAWYHSRHAHVRGRGPRARRRRSARRPRGAALAARPARGTSRSSSARPTRSSSGCARRPFDLLLMDLNYTRDTTSGREGLELIPRVRAHDPGAADRRHDRLGQHRHGRRSDAARRQELRAEAVGRRDAARDRAARDRRGAGDAASDAKQQREFEEARLIQRGLLPTALPQIDGVRVCRRHGSRPTASAATASMRMRVRRSAIGVVDRRRRRQGHSRGAADVEPAGGRARIRAGRRRARVDLRQRQSPAVPAHGQRPVRHVLFRVARRACADR